MHNFQSSPITLFDLSDLQIDENRIIQETAHICHKLPFDIYDLKKLQIEYIRNQYTNRKDALFLELLINYYEGKDDATYINSLAENLSKKEKEIFFNLRPFRRRAISNFEIIFENDTTIEMKRLDKSAFIQNNGKILNKEEIDYRVLPRIFSETPLEISESEIFRMLLEKLALKIRKAFSNVPKKIYITCHHTCLYTYLNRPTNNSPEGIHQDGYDIIIPALVIKRYNITDGASRVFLGDNKIEIFNTILKNGQGLLHTDKNTDIWHTVDNIYVKNPKVNIGYRISLGFDISFS